MTPAINLVKKEKIPHRVHEYEHDPNNTAYGEEAVEALGLDANQVFKTLLAKIDAKELVVAIIPVAAQLNLKSIAAATGGKRAVMADIKEAEGTTGYVAGGISPLGQRKRLKTFMDESAFLYDEVFISAGRRGLEISLSPHDLLTLLNAKRHPLAT